MIFSKTMSFFKFGIWSEGNRAILAMIFNQVAYAGMVILAKAALNKGMSDLVFVAYRQAIATLVLAPFAYSLERSKAPTLSASIVFKIFFLSFFGLTLSMVLYYKAFRHTSATLAITIQNMLPVITFIITFLLRMETLNLRALSGYCKILGVLFCIGGSVVLCLYDGPKINLFKRSSHTVIKDGMKSSIQGEEKNNTIMGPILMFAACTIWATWLVLQAQMLKIYPAKLRLTALQCFFSSIQTTIIALAVQRDINSWMIGWDVQLLSVVYCGVVVTGISYWLQIWCSDKKGPFYVSMFAPLSLIVTAILSALIWSELLNCGSVIGGVLIVGGLYSVVWGKRKEEIEARMEKENEKYVAAQQKLTDVEMG